MKAVHAQIIGPGLLRTFIRLVFALNFDVNISLEQHRENDGDNQGGFCAVSTDQLQSASLYLTFLYGR